jgi:WD40 repeat protein
MGKLEIRRIIQTYQPAYTVAQSQDGQYFAVGVEEGVVIYSLSGEKLALHRLDIPVHQVVTTPDFTQVFFATRSGEVVQLTLSSTDDGVEIEAQELYQTKNDIHSLALAAQAGYIAVGRLSFALAVLHPDGKTAWEQYDDHFAAEGSTWSVSFGSKGKRLYAGSASSTTNRLGILDASSGKEIEHRNFGVPIACIDTFPNENGLAVALNEDFYLARLVAYDTDIETVLWEHKFDQPITAMSSDPQKSVLTIAVGYGGRIILLDAQQGQILAEKAVRSTVNDLSLVKGRLIAAVTQDKNLIRLRYLR